LEKERSLGSGWGPVKKWTGLCGFGEEGRVVRKGTD